MINANEKAKRLASVMMNETVNKGVLAGKNPMSIAGQMATVILLLLVLHRLPKRISLSQIVVVVFIK
jgi:hypothetical protein